MDRDTAEPRVDAIPGERAREWVTRQREVAAPSTHVYDFVWDVTAPAEGPFCTDVDGNVLMDFTSHVAAAPLGYDNPLIAERLDEFDLVDPVKVAGQDFYLGSSGPAAQPDVPGPKELMDRLVDVADVYGMDTVFLSNSGAEAIENAMKICYDYREGAARGITFTGAFHGRTLGALSLNRSKAVHRRDFPEVAGIAEVPFCDDRTCTRGTCSCGFFPGGDGGVGDAGDDGAEAASSLLRRKLDPDGGNLDPEDVAFVVVEPIQGEGGVRVPSEAFADELAAVCADYGIPLIADEIQTGLGRTGEWWGSDHYALEPDVLTAAKGLRVGATVSRRDVFPEERSRLSSTWGAGDVLASLVGVLTIDAIGEAELLSNARERGRQAIELLRDADLDHAVDVRGRGLLLAVEFDTKARRDAVMECCFKRRGLLTLPAGRKSLRLLPPLDVTGREIELGVGLLVDSVEDREVRAAEPQRETGDDVS